MKMPWFLSAGLMLGLCCLVAASLATGAETNQYRQAYPLRVIIGLDPIIVRLTAPESEAGSALNAELINYESRVVAFSNGRWEADGKSVSFSLKPDNYGLFRVVVHKHGGTPQTVFASQYAVLRPLPSHYTTTPASAFRFGVNVHFDQRKGDLDILPQLIARTGFRWVRDSLDWGGVEKTKGVYAIPDYNRKALDVLKKQGISSLLCLCYGNRFYPHTSEEEAKAYGNYAEFAARELKGYGDTFEIWNEPNGFGKLTPTLYPRILKSGFEGVKKGNPNALVIGIGGASPGGWSAWYITEILKVGGQAWMDSFSIHPYCSPHTAEVGYLSQGGPAPRASIDYTQHNTLGLADKIREAKGFQRRPGVWVTEIGWPTTQVSPNVQAQQIARWFIYCAAKPDDIERSFVYDFLCDGTNPKDMEHTFGLVAYDYSPRPSYVSTATAARAVDGRPFLRRIQHPYDGVHLYLFGTKEDAVLAGWVAELSGKELESGKMEDGTVAENYVKAGSLPDRVIEVDLGGIDGNPVLRDWQDRDCQPILKEKEKIRLRLTVWLQYIYGLRNPSAITIVQPGNK